MSHGERADASNKDPCPLLDPCPLFDPECKKLSLALEQTALRCYIHCTSVKCYCSVSVFMEKTQ